MRRATRCHCLSRAVWIDFYPRSPCGERRVTSSAGTIGKSFLSTLSLRRATNSRADNVKRDEDFYPRSPCGERRRNGHNVNREHHISIHALLAESDVKTDTSKQFEVVFLSTLSLRRATKPKALKSRLCVISIHALLAESDPTAARNDQDNMNFYPRSPCGERRYNNK